jgi:hypothetical protein
MTDGPIASTPCAVANCRRSNIDPQHVVDTRPAGALPLRVPLCPDHWEHVERGGEWLAEEEPGEPGRRGIRVVLGNDLVERGITVANESDIAWRRGGFSSMLDPQRNVGVLGIEGRVYGSDRRARLDLALTPEAVRQLRFALRLYTDTGEPR